MAANKKQIKLNPNITKAVKLSAPKQADRLQIFNFTLYKSYFFANLKVCLIMGLFIWALTVLAPVISKNAFSALGVSLPINATYYIEFSIINQMIITTILYICFIVFATNNILCAQVDRGSMAYTLSAPIKRTTVTNTAILYLASILFVMFTIQMFLHLIFNGNYSLFGQVLAVYLLNYLYFLSLAAICFLFSCYFNLSKYYFACALGICFYFFMTYFVHYVTNSLYAAGENPFEFLKYISLQSLIGNGIFGYILGVQPGPGGSGVDFVSSDQWVVICAYIVLILVPIGGFIGGSFLFKNKDLPL
ncbi:MAG: hypothetical protein LBC33_02485 [Mycoplasmataceae bacterium]|jgi:ABC-2 type transport system permease protein|nr:hypothetical protein [Mycoplasmataceae bacterium]